MNRNHRLVHRLNTYIKNLELPENSHWLLALSGGADSVALFHLCVILKGVLGFEISVAHVHHGDSDSKEQRAFRDQALQFCKNLAGSHGVDFYTNSHPPDRLLCSEADFREFRWKWLNLWHKQLCEKQPNSLVAVAHNKEDALETRLIQLIRGAGEQGLMGLRVYSDGKIRPLLQVCRSEILSFLKENGVHWLEDPSNTSTEPLRNWMRHKWLRDLESQRPGATESLARSLETLTQSISDTQSQLPLSQLFKGQALRRDVFLQLSRRQKCRVLALFLSRLEVDGFTSGHIEEILKRLDTHKKELTFCLLSVQWTISADMIQASRV